MMSLIQDVIETLFNVTYYLGKIATILLCYFSVIYQCI